MQIRLGEPRKKKNFSSEEAFVKITPKSTPHSHSISKGGKVLQSIRKDCLVTSFFPAWKRLPKLF